MRNKIILLFVLIISIFLIIGCVTKTDKTTNQKTNKTQERNKDVYIKYIKKLKKVKKTTEDLPFTVEVKYEKMKNEVRYQVIIDNPTTEITDLSAISVHNKQTDDVFPSVGIFDKKVKLIPDKKPSGVILVGYIPYSGSMDDLDVEIKTLISYKIDNETHTSYYVTKK